MCTFPVWKVQNSLTAYRCTCTHVMSTLLCVQYSSTVVQLAVSIHTITDYSYRFNHTYYIHLKHTFIHSYNIQYSTAVYTWYTCGTYIHVVYTQVSLIKIYIFYMYLRRCVHSTLAPPLPCSSINALKNPQANLSIVSFYVSVLILPTFVLI